MSSVNASVSPDGMYATLMVSGRFDFSLHGSVREVCKQLQQGAQCVVDLSQVSYLDSSALGMLLVLRDIAPTTVLRGAPPAVRRVLEIASFSQLFRIEQ